MKRVTTVALTAIGSLAVAGSVVAAPPEVSNLRCEYRVNPTGIDIANPRFCWTVLSGRRGEKQTAYQILVASSPQRLAKNSGDLWDSGKVASEQCAQVAYAGTTLASRMRCHWKVRVWDRDGNPSGWSRPALWTMGLLQPTDWSASWIGSEEGKVTQPFGSEQSEKTPLATPRYLRKEFQVSAPIRRATVYTTALGLYELRLNGKRVGDHLLAPEWTRYTHHVQVDAVDVTALLRRGDNAIGAIVGNGWYSGIFMCWPQRKRIYGDRPWLLSQLEIETTDGQRTVIASDGTWRVSTNGPLRQSGIYEGETYDARRELVGWDMPGFNDTTWQNASVGDGLKVGKLVWQRSEPIRVTHEFKPVSVTEPKPGVFVFDLGQNIAGWCRFTAQAPEGTIATLRHAEVLNPDGTVYTDNLRGAAAIDHYTFRGTGQPEVFEPHFTYHGFRYVEVTGLPDRPKANAILGRMFHTDMADVGSFECSQPLVNKLAQNIRWSMRANYMGVPTDCPNRDERTGCTGDHQFFMPTALYNMDVAAFYSKWLVDLCEDAHSDNGVFADVAPYYGMWPGLSDAWGDAGIICPYYAWQTYGDTRIIVEHYQAMRNHHAYLVSTAKDNHRQLNGPGDWLNMGGTAKPEVIATAYYAYLTDLMAQMAAAIGKAEDAQQYQKLATDIRSAFVRDYFTPDGALKDCSQTGYALAFTMGLTPDELRAKAADHFAQEVSRFNNTPTAGFIGIPRLLPGLHLAGRDDLAYKLLLQDKFPSWLQMVKSGATTIWERWDSYIPGKGFQDPGMNSFNHVVYGVVGEYLYGVVGGIQAASPGYRDITIQPVPGPGITWAKASYRSIYGLVATEWKLARGKFSLTVTIPVGATAVVHVPTSNADAITESGDSAAHSTDVQLAHTAPNEAIFEVKSGRYTFVSPFALPSNSGK